MDVFECCVHLFMWVVMRSMANLALAEAISAVTSGRLLRIAYLLLVITTLLSMAISLIPFISGWATRFDKSIRTAPIDHYRSNTRAECAAFIILLVASILGAAFMPTIYGVTCSVTTIVDIIMLFIIYAPAKKAQLARWQKQQFAHKYALLKAAYAAEQRRGKWAAIWALSQIGPDLTRIVISYL